MPNDKNSPSAYVSARVHELADGEGWDADHVEAIVTSAKLGVHAAAVQEALTCVVTLIDRQATLADVLDAVLALEASVMAAAHMADSVPVRRNSSMQRKR